MKNYESGQIKVVWVGEDTQTIHSRMFNNLQKARYFALKKADFIIFRLIQQENMEEFTWELLPYGKYKLYLSILQTYKKPKSAFTKLIDTLLP